MMKNHILSQEKILLSGLKQGDREAFTLLFTSYYKDLVLFGGNFIREKAIVEDIVQSVFLKLWDDRETLHIETNLRSYLLSTIQNSCIDELRHSEIVRDYHSLIEKGSVLNDCDTENYIFYSDLHVHLDEALGKLPQKVREAFELNRFEGLKYQEIAQRLDVSLRTVEVHIGKALELLRFHLREFFILIGTIILLTFK